MLHSGTAERVKVKVGSARTRFVQDNDDRELGEYGANRGAVKADRIWLMPGVDDDGFEPLALAGATTTSW